MTGIVDVPGDKSVSHRALLLSALAAGDGRIRGPGTGDDVARTLALVRALGVEVAAGGPDAWVVRGRGLHGLAAPASPIDCGGSATTMRLGAGLLAGQPFAAVLTGSPALLRRPMGRVVEPLRRMGATVDADAGGARAPLRIAGGRLAGLRHAPDPPSAQVKSAILLAGLSADGPVEVVEPVPTRDHTERLLAAMGAGAGRDGDVVRLHPPARLDPLDLAVPGDFSSAAFFLALAAGVPGACVRIRNVGLNPSRTALLGVLARMGAVIEVEPAPGTGPEPAGDLVVRGTSLQATTVAPAEIPGLIDEIPALCALAARAEGRTEVRGAGELRVKESDRIASTVAALDALGVRCGALADGLWVEGPARVRDGAAVDPAGDHRIAMAAAVAAAAAGTALRLADPACVDKSFPGFLAILARFVQ